MQRSPVSRRSHTAVFKPAFNAVVMPACRRRRVQVSAFTEPPTEAEKAIVKAIARDEVAIALQPVKEQLTQMNVNLIKIDEKLNKLATDVEVLKISTSRDIQELKISTSRDLQLYLLITLIAIPLLTMGFSAVLPFLVKTLP